MDISLFAPTPHRIQNVQIMEDDQQIKIVSIVALLVNSGARLNIIFIVDISLYLTNATALRHSRELVGLKPS